MPTYDYVCQACGHRLEIFQSMSDPLKKKCPACGKSKLQRQIGTGAAILFKGSGFYQTDYRSSSYTEGAKQDAPASEAKPKPDTAASPSSAPAESKPAAAPVEKSSKSARKKPA